MVARAETATILKMQDITKRFPGVVALDRVSFEVQVGQVHCLVGENGAGKSTLMKIMSGVYTEFGGQMLLNGETVTFHNTREAQDSGIAMIHQELNLVFELTVYENIFLGREIKTRLGVIDRRAMRRASEKIMADLGLDIDSNRHVSQLRVGQRQLVEIAKALSLNSRIIIMDEPTSALSDSEVEYLFRVIRGLREHDVAVIYISHRLDEIFTIADQITVLRDGRVAGSALATEITRQQLISRMVGRDLDVLYPKEKVDIGDTVLEVENLNYTQGRTRVLENVSLSVRRGEIVGLAGLMGAGRTQFLEALFGVYPPQSVTGKILLNGQPAKFTSPQTAIANGLGLIAEDRKQQSLVLERSVTENTTLAALRLFMNWLTVIRQRAERQAVTRVSQDLNVKTPTIETLVANLSGGNQQKVVIAKFLLSEIVLFLLDEPTRGIDVGAKAEIYHLVGQLAKNGTAFLLVSSEMSELLAVCDRIYVLCDGRLTGEFNRDAFDQEAIMEAATRFAEKVNNGNAVEERSR
ncbi:MAG TPA: sugar ABC transporter ATP-binding protein [Phototrophicaceae bacterium]|nr:sugar ABC transporter ATP-binding protein [Phototrophicaceae bacterium]